MAITQLDTEANVNADIKTAAYTILTHTPTVDMVCQALVFLGGGGNVLDGTGGNFEFTITIAGYTVQPAPQVIVFGTETTASVWTSPFPVEANSEVIIKVLSPNAADTTVNTEAFLYDVSAAATNALTAWAPPTKAEMDTMEVNLTAEIDANETKIDALENISAADVNAQCDASIETYGLDHLLSAALADDGDIVDNSAIAQLAATAGDFSTFSKTTDSLQSIRDATGSLGGSGAVTDTFTIEEPVGTPEAGVDVWISTDEAGTNVIAGTLVSDVSGEVEFSLDETTGLWVHVQKSGINFTGYPKEFDVLVGGFSWA